MDHGLRRLEEDYVARGGEPGSEDWAARLVVSDGHVVGKGLLAVGDGIVLPDGRVVRVTRVVANGPREDFVTTALRLTGAEEEARDRELTRQNMASFHAGRPQRLGGHGDR
jgi:hypothetical protein